MDHFGTLSDGRPVHRAVIANAHLRVAVLDFGAILQDVRLAGEDLPRTLGFPDVAPYEALRGLFGPVIAPVANRIAGARAEIAGHSHRLETNEGDNTLHSGGAGTQHKIWDLVDERPDAVGFALDLPDGEGGFPGNRRIAVTYRLRDAALEVEITARTDAETLMNVTQHAFWTAQSPEDWAGQTLTIHADSYLPVTAETLPTGEIAPVAGTSFDFRAPRRLDPAALPPIDHNFCLGPARGALRPAVRLAAPGGAWMTIETTAPGVQVFDLSGFGISETGLHGFPYPRRAAIAFEPQDWPDAPGRPGWPDITLRPDARFRQVTRYTFGRG